jgi:hypothetical protein
MGGIFKFIYIHQGMHQNLDEWGNFKEKFKTLLQKIQGIDS